MTKCVNNTCTVPGRIMCPTSMSSRLLLLTLLLLSLASSLHSSQMSCTPLILLLYLFHDLKLECNSALEEASMIFGV